MNEWVKRVELKRKNKAEDKKRFIHFEIFYITKRPQNFSLFNVKLKSGSCSSFFFLFDLLYSKIKHLNRNTSGVLDFLSTYNEIFLLSGFRRLVKKLNVQLWTIPNSVRWWNESESEILSVECRVRATERKFSSFTSNSIM